MHHTCKAPITCKHFCSTLSCDDENVNAHVNLNKATGSINCWCVKGGNKCNWKRTKQSIEHYEAVILILRCLQLSHIERHQSQLVICECGPDWLRQEGTKISLASNISISWHKLVDLSNRGQNVQVSNSFEKNLLIVLLYQYFSKEFKPPTMEYTVW